MLINHDLVPRLSLLSLNILELLLLKILLILFLLLLKSFPGALDAVNVILDLLDLITNLVFGFAEESLTLIDTFARNFLYLLEAILELVTELEEVLGDLGLWIEHEECLTGTFVVVQTGIKETLFVAFVKESLNV